MAPSNALVIGAEALNGGEGAPRIRWNRAAIHHGWMKWPVR
jgi:hypothetical protein